jgi:hypothetical protein
VTWRRGKRRADGRIPLRSQCAKETLRVRGKGAVFTNLVDNFIDLDPEKAAWRWAQAVSRSRRS